ncbi:ATP-binding cassette domain-containing protein [Populibacterium corticicola]|uniref:ATP-binding cassette domain-containing protein n=1 Tax=Populibacterium corticicola TaxID=1812826 RepID=A0ABW5XHP1_9MICO
MSLVITDLTVTTSGGKTLLDNISWSVDSGKRLGIIGESGSGKSLTAQAILGLLPHGMKATGSIQFNGRELLGAPESELRHVRGAQIAMVFQEPLTALDPLMKVGKQIAGPLKLHTSLNKSQIVARSRELLELVSLREVDRVLGSYPWQLSGGQRQRVSIAMALACEPELLIADEPTTALDVTVQAEILDLLSEVIDKTGTTLVFVSHDLPVISKVAEGLVVMRNGRVVEETTVAQALRTPQHPYTRTLLDAARAITLHPPHDLTSHDLTLHASVSASPHTRRAENDPDAATLSGHPDQKSPIEESAERWDVTGSSPSSTARASRNNPADSTDQPGGTV